MPSFTAEAVYPVNWLGKFLFLLELCDNLTNNGHYEAVLTGSVANNNEKEKTV